MDYSLLFLHRNANHVWCIIDIMYKTKWTLGIFIILLGVTTLYAAPPIKLGMSGAFTGPSGKLGTQLLAGASLYFDKLNAEGGIHGQWVQIQSYDDRYDPLITVYNTATLLQRDQTPILFQYVGTPTTTLMLPLLHASHSHPLLMFPFTGAETLREMPYQPMIYNFRASYREETKTLIDFFITQKKHKIGILYQADAYGRSGWDGVRKALHQHNLDLVSEASYQRNFTFKESMKAQIEILKIGQPDAVIIIGAYAAAAAFIRDARESHWEIPLGNLSFVGVESLLELLNDHASQHQQIYENIYITQVLPYYKDASLPAIREYLTLAKEAGEPPNYVGLEGYINAKLLSQLLLKTTAPFAIEKLSALLERNHRIDIGLEEPVSIGGKEHQGSHHVYLTQITRGILTPVQGAP
jgi:branched-chain amino acid transport system substrate-binding protein